MTPDPTVTAVSDETLRMWVDVGNPDVRSMAAELLRARSALADVGEALLSAYRHMQSTGAHESYLTPQRKVLEAAGYTFDALGYYIGTGKQPRPAEPNFLRCIHGRMTYERCVECENDNYAGFAASDAAHTAQVTDYDIALAGIVADGLNDFGSVMARGDDALRDLLTNAERILRRLASTAERE